MVMPKAMGAWVAVTMTLLASVASACPVCASREEPSSLRWVALGAFIVTPWLIAGGVALYIKRGADLERRESLQLPTENSE
jgi:hypothetical protein